MSCRVADHQSRIISMMTRRQKSLTAVVAALSLLLIPFPYLASPQWTVTVVDETGRPLSGMLVRLDYENYSVENSSHEVDLYTAENGQVTFPLQRRSASLLRRCWFTASSAAAFVHASFGPSAYVNVFGMGREGSAVSDGYIYFWKGHPDSLKTTIIANSIRNQS